MRWFFFLLSLLFISLGTMLILHSRETRGYVRNWFYGYDVRLLAGAPFAMGVLLVMGAFKVREVFGLAFVLGLLALAKGAYLAFGPREQIKGLRDWWFEEAGDNVLRLSGLVMFLVGAAFLSWLV
jgi:hypothetical protein